LVEPIITNEKESAIFLASVVLMVAMAVLVA
jgi:hypothetical protein